jgi:hypothetical protein
VSNSGNSANTNVMSANVQVDPTISAKNRSANVVVSHNDNDNDNDNDNRNDADADADALAANGNLNVNAGVNDVDNANTDRNANTGTNTGSNSNTGSNNGTNTNNGTQSSTNTNTGSPEPPTPPPFEASRLLCEAYQGTFTFVGEGLFFWTCNGLPDIGAARQERFEDLQRRCIFDGGARLVWQNSPNFPEDDTCQPFL